MSRVIRVVSPDATGKPETIGGARPAVGPMDGRPRRNSDYESMHPPSRPYPKTKTRLWGTDRGEDE